MVEFKNKDTGTIYIVSNPDLVAIYEADERFEKVEEKKPEKKTTSKK